MQCPVLLEQISFSLQNQEDNIHQLYAREKIFHKLDVKNFSSILGLW